MDKPVHQEVLNGHTIKIYHADDAENPRDWDNLGTMICGHPRYQLGEKHSFGGGREFLLDLLGLGCDCPLDVDQLLTRTEKIAIILPVYLYDHSGLMMNTTGFHCSWDSAQVGFIYVTTADVREEYSVKRVSPQLRKKVEGYLRQEVQTFSDYLSGAVYGYVVEKDGEETDSCWGFIGCYETYCLKEARDCVPVNEKQPVC